MQIGGTGCTSNKVNDPGKNNAVVMQIYCPPKKDWTVYASTTLGGNIVKWPQGTFKSCVVAKGVGIFTISFAAVNHRDNGKTQYNINSPDYKTYCTPTSTIGLNGQYVRGGESGYMNASDIPSPDPTLLTIASMTMYWYAPGAAPAANGK